MAKRKVLCVIGTRPEAVKMSPVVMAFKRRPGDFDVKVVATAQHRNMLDQVLNIFKIVPDIDLDIMAANQTLTHITCRVLTEMEKLFTAEAPDIVLAQGDTTTVMATATACFYHHVAFGHIEAGLRTGDMQAPFPEEFNRRVATMVSRWHFAPTETSRDNLLKEGIPNESIHVVGNTVVDALYHLSCTTLPPPKPMPAGAQYILMTCHRREVFGDKILDIFRTIRTFALAHKDIFIWYPVHPNPNVSVPAHAILDGLDNVKLTEPLDYVAFIHAINDAFIIISDSGGIQEEAIALHKPLLVLRNITERPEGAESGACRLVGPNPDRILAALESLMNNPPEYQKMVEAKNPYGTGFAAGQIAAILANE